MKPISEALSQLVPSLEAPVEPGPMVSTILDYLKHQLPGYHFEPRLDLLFVAELLQDFPDTDILEQIKTFRWYHDNEPLSGVKTQRVALRRWIARAARSCYR
jgi:hypothetical protein